jgi:broad specificity phosphatase PhoE
MRNLSDESDDYPSRLIDARCKICKSEHLAEINQMLIEGRPYSEIIAKFPDLKLNKNNIYRHKRHFNFIKRGVEKYYEQLEEGAEKVVDEIKALDATIARMHEYVMRVDPEVKPRVVEVCINGMLRAIKLKHELAGNIEDPGQKLLALFEEAVSEE